MRWIVGGLVSVSLLAVSGIAAWESVDVSEVTPMEADEYGAAYGRVSSGGDEMACCRAINVREVDTAAEFVRAGLLLGRAEEAARRDVAPAVVVELIRGSMGNRSERIAAILDRLASQIGQTESPAEALRFIDDANTKLTTIAESKILSDVTVATGVPRGAESVAWTGTWDTTYGTMVLSIGDDGSIVGAYGAAEHEIVGHVDPAEAGVLAGTWREGTSEGRFRFRLDDAGQWEGHWASGGADPLGSVNWRGSRVVDAGALARWDGEWQTSYGTMTLRSSGSGLIITGSYGSPTNRVVGWVEPSRPDVLVGYWYYENTSSFGRLEFRLTNDTEWTGGWTSGLSEPSPGSWNGKRNLDQIDRSGDVMESVGPAEAMEAGSVSVDGYGGFLGEE